MNKSDSERISAVLEKNGFKPASKQNEADLIVVNMCSVRQSAVDRIFGISQKFSKLKIKNKKLKTILTGCILKKDREKFRKRLAPHQNLWFGAGFDLILDIKDLENWQNYLSPIFYGRGKYGINGKSGNYLRIQPKYQSKFSAFIPISSGCNNCCTYCAVPYTRGKLICRPHQEILKEVKNALKNGAKEIWLLGQNVNSYGVQRETDAKQNTKLTRKINFAELLKMVNDIPGNFWIRFTSPHPSDFSDELIETMARCKKITPYLNLPVQSGDNEILKRMNRGYTVKEYKAIVKKIREKFESIRDGIEKQVSISTDAIVGFPGETKRQFENTVKLFKKIKFDMAYIAEYSPRPVTAAAKLKDDVSIAEKKRRQKVINDILKKTALENNKKFIGKTIEVLAENCKNRFLIGKSRHYKTVQFKEEKDLIGQFARVKITDVLTWGLKGEII